MHCKYFSRKSIVRRSLGKAPELLREQESQDHRKAEVGRDLCRPSGPTPCSRMKLCSFHNSQKRTTRVLTFWCPNSFNIVPSFFVLLWSLCAAMAGLGSLQSTDRRWYQRCWPSWMCADFMLGSKRCTSHPLLAMLISNWLSSLPSLQNKKDVIINAAKRPTGE